MNAGSSPHSRLVTLGALLVVAALACSLPPGGVTPASPPLPPTEAPPTGSPATSPPTLPPVPTTAPPATGAQPTVIFHNGTILTMDDAQPEAQAVALRGGKLIAVGGEAEVLALVGAATQVIDLGGLTLMPGFVDAHNHIFGRPDVYGNEAGAQQAAIEHGITTSTEMYVDSAILDSIQSFERNGQLRLRLNLYLAYNNSCGDPNGDWYLDYPTSRPLGDKLWISGIKIFSDGGSCNVPAVSFEFPSGGHGDLYFTEDELSGVITDLQARGYQVAIHTLGDRSAEVVQNAIASALAGGPNVYRHRMEHNAVLRPELLPRYSEIGIVPVLFGDYATCWKLNPTNQFKYAVPDQYRDWEWPWRKLLDANPGLTFAWHTDAPILSLDPIRSLYGFVTRNDVADDGSVCQAPDWLAANAITADEALHMMSIGSAYATFRDEVVGSLVPGKFADLIILSGNPLTVEPDSLKDLSVLMTMIEGQVEYCAAGSEPLCPG
jgi:predicted amidohydrolase YtcJ